MSGVIWHGTAFLKQLEGKIEATMDVAASIVKETALLSMKEPKSGTSPVMNKKGTKAARYITVSFATGRGQSDVGRMGRATFRVKQSLKHQRSAPGEAPAVQGGDLWRSVHVENTGKMRRRVGTYLAYGLYLELGTRKMSARPWLRPALYKSRPVVQRMIAMAQFGQIGTAK